MIKSAFPRSIVGHVWVVYAIRCTESGLECGEPSMQSICEDEESAKDMCEWVKKNFSSGGDNYNFFYEKEELWG